MLFEGFGVSENTTWEDLIDFVIRNSDKSHDDYCMRVRNNKIYVGIMNVGITFRKEDFSVIRDSIYGEWHMSLKNETIEVYC